MSLIAYQCVSLTTKRRVNASDLKTQKRRHDYASPGERAQNKPNCEERLDYTQ